ncbi:MAG TPA: NAD(P)H-binding protein [Propionibacteriaceae bacterium]
MRIAVTTPTGNVGRHVVPMLIRSGLRPTVLVRSPARLDPAVAHEVDAVVVDQGDGDAVVAATRGMDALFWVDPPTMAADPIAEFARVGAIAARAVEENGISRVVFQSSIGAELRHGVGEIDGLARTEEVLEETDAAVLHLRCGYFFTNLLLQLDAVRRGVLQVVVPLDQPLPWVAPRDIAEVAVLRLLSPGWTGRQVQAVHGPEDLTWNEAAAVVAQATGHPLRVERISDEAMRAGLRESGMGPGLVEAVMGMSTGMRDGFVPEQPRTAATTTPTSLASWAYDVLRPQL